MDRMRMISIIGFSFVVQGLFPRSKFLMIDDVQCFSDDIDDVFGSTRARKNSN